MRYLTLRKLSNHKKPDRKHKSDNYHFVVWKSIENILRSMPTNLKSVRSTWPDIVSPCIRSKPYLLHKWCFYLVTTRVKRSNDDLFYIKMSQMVITLSSKSQWVSEGFLKPVKLKYIIRVLLQTCKCSKCAQN